MWVEKDMCCKISKTLTHFILLTLWVLEKQTYSLFFRKHCQCFHLPPRVSWNYLTWAAVQSQSICRATSRWLLMQLRYVVLFITLYGLLTNWKWHENMFMYKILPLFDLLKHFLGFPGQWQILHIWNRANHCFSWQPWDDTSHLLEEEIQTNSSYSLSY